MMETPFRIKPALPSELSLLSEIDDDAMLLLREHGIHIDLPADHAFARAEAARWLRSAELGRAEHQHCAHDQLGGGLHRFHHKFSCVHAHQNVAWIEA